MNPTIVLCLALVASASASITQVTPEEQDQQQQPSMSIQQLQQQQQQQQQYAQASVVQPTVIGAVPIDVYYQQYLNQQARPVYRQAYAVQQADAGDQKSASELQANLVQPQGVAVRAVNYIPYPVQAQVLQGAAGRYLNFHPVSSPLGLGARLGGSIHISPAARGFALGGLTGLGVGLASRGLLAGTLAGPIGLGLHGALSTPALGVGLGAGAAALLG